SFSLEVQSMALGALRENLYHTTTALENVSRGLVLDNISALGQVTKGLSLNTTALEQVAKGAVLNNVSAMQSTLENLREAASFSLASSLIDFQNLVVYDVPEPVEIDDEFSNKEVNRVLAEDSHMREERLGEPVPYNVLSSYFIHTYYLPTLGIVWSLTNGGDHTPESIIVIIISTIVPMIRSMSKDIKENQNTVIDFEEDVVPLC